MAGLVDPNAVALYVKPQTTGLFYSSTGGGAPAWVPNGALAYYEFTTDRGYSAGTVKPSSTSDWTETRAGVAYDMAGTTQFGANTMRRTAAGLLIEPAATNVLFQASAYSTTPWVDRNAPTITPGQTAPDGTTNASSVTVGLAGAGGVNLYQLTTGSSGGSAPSFFIKKITGSGSLNFENPQGPTFGQWIINFASLGSGWERIIPTHPAVTITTAFTQTAGAAGQYFFTGSGTISWNMWGNQYEDGSAPSSFIPTTTAAVTRPADAAAVTLAGGITTALYTFDDSSTQSIAASGAYTIPTNLNRRIIQSVKFT